MAGVIFKMVKFILLYIIVVFLLLPQFVNAEGYDLTYDDPSKDVKDMFGGYISGYEHLDITQINSYETNFGTHIVLEMTVGGLITDSEDINYDFYIMDGEEEVYYIIYCDGTCTGYDYQDGSSNVLQASGAGSDTLEVRIQISEVEDISSYDFYGEAMEYDDVNSVYPWDRAPDEEDDWDDDDYYYYFNVPIMITEPRPGSTVYGTKTIKGITQYWGGEIESVDVQLDSTNSGGWQKALSYDSWDTWSFEWDTKSVSDGEHTINARAFDGSEYHYDSIEVHVDQSALHSPKTANVPELLVGTVLEYDIIYFDNNNIYSFFGDVYVDAEMSMTVITIETAQVDDKKYETYKVEMDMKMDMTIVFADETIIMETEMDSMQWLRVSDLSAVKMEMNLKMGYSYFGTTMNDSMESTSLYDPPLDTFNFPIKIGETWNAISTVTTTATTSGSFSGSYSNTDVSESEQEYEALHAEDVTVPAGTYETFVIWSEASSNSALSAGTSLLTMGSGYTLTYYSPELGFPVKIETYDNTRELQLTIELSSYKEGVSQNPASESGGWELPICYIFLLVLLVLIIASVMVVRKRRQEEKAAAVPQAQYAKTQVGISTNPPHSGAYVPFAYPVQSSQYPPQAYPVQTASYPHAVPSQIVFYGQMDQVHTTSPYQYAPSASHANITPSTFAQHAQTPGYQPQPRKSVSPMVEVECPNCSRVFSVPLKSAKVHCPFCNTTGRME